MLSISQKTKHIEQLYFKHQRKPSIFSLNLQHCLSHLENTLANNHSQAQFYSFKLFLKICFENRKQLPNDYNEFAQANKLILLFNMLHASPFFNAKAPNEVSFVKRSVKTLTSEAEYSATSPLFGTALTTFPPVPPSQENPLRVVAEEKISPS